MTYLKCTLCDLNMRSHIQSYSWFTCWNISVRTKHVYHIKIIYTDIIHANANSFLIHMYKNTHETLVVNIYVPFEGDEYVLHFRAAYNSVKTCDNIAILMCMWNYIYIKLVQPQYNLVRWSKIRNGKLRVI